MTIFVNPASKEKQHTPTSLRTARRHFKRSQYQHIDWPEPYQNEETEKKKTKHTVQFMNGSLRIMYTIL